METNFEFGKTLPVKRRLPSLNGRHSAKMWLEALFCMYFYVPFFGVLTCVRSAYQDLSNKIDTTGNAGLGEPKGKKGKVSCRSKDILYSGR